MTLLLLLLSEMVVKVIKENWRSVQCLIREMHQGSYSYACSLPQSFSIVENVPQGKKKVFKPAQTETS